MATSGSVDFSVSRDNLIGDALRLVGALGPDDSPSSNQLTHSARMLNMMVKAWQSPGLSLWARKTGYIMPQSDLTEIDLGPSGDEATLSFVVTQLAADAGAAASTITVDSITGISASDRIGVELDDGTIDWTTVSGAPSGTTVTLTATLDSAASTDNYVWVYTTKIVRPLRIVEAYLRTYTSSSVWTERPIDVVEKEEYELLGDKLAEHDPTFIAYDPLLTDGRAYLGGEFPDGDSLVKIVFQRPFEDFDAAGDTPDFPQEWYLALCYGLAVILAPTYGMPVVDRKQLQVEATLAFEQAESNEPEQGSMRILPTDEGR